jgi:DNA mismatch repair protein MutS
VAEQGEALVFLRKVVPGGADRSYGVHVARMAGVPKSIVQRAEAVLLELEAGGSKERRRAVMQDLPSPVAANTPNIQLSLFGGGPDPLVTELRDLKVDDMTPIEALSKLYELRQKARESGGGGQ